ncbi:flavin reductase family protein [Streptomyces beigongshangae]|uniref:flavin reductase family protein n=1 Tax=Streptomyces beigongshangae TaxID=2841597 RepID=UPI001C8556E4|nr:flavin reductase family protein [Streptomyces sp. REN17]
MSVTVSAGPRQPRPLRHLASAVSILTVRHSGRPHGTTVGTVTAVSQRPPLLGVCLRIGSTFAQLAMAEGRFVVNVLDASQTGLARRFADRARADGAEQFTDVPWNPDPCTGAPLLAGALAHYSCRVLALPRVGDHDVLLGRVTRAAAHQGVPLLSYAGDMFAGAIPSAAACGAPARNRKENIAT